MLKKLGIVKTKNKGYKVFMEHIAPDFLDNTMIPSEYVKAIPHRKVGAILPEVI